MSAAKEHYGRALTLQPLSLSRAFSLRLQSCQPSESLSPASPRPYLAQLLEAQSALRSRVRKINLSLGRDAEACLRPLAQESRRSVGKEKQETQGFRKVEHMSSEPVLTYLKTISKGNNSERRLLPPLIPTTRWEKDRKPSPGRLSLSERWSLQEEMKRHMQTCRAQLQARVSKAMDRANKMHIFPKEVNQVRGLSLVEMGEMGDLAAHMKKYYRRKVEELRKRKGEQGEMMITAVREEEPDKRTLLEGKLVDKVAWTERKAYESQANLPKALTTEQIEAKVRKMKAESLRKLPELRKVRNLPDASLI